MPLISRKTPRRIITAVIVADGAMSIRIPTRIATIPRISIAHHIAPEYQP